MPPKAKPGKKRDAMFVGPGIVVASGTMAQVPPTEPSMTEVSRQEVKEGVAPAFSVSAAVHEDKRQSGPFAGFGVTASRTALFANLGSLFERGVALAKTDKNGANILLVRGQEILFNLLEDLGPDDKEDRAKAEVLQGSYAEQLRKNCDQITQSDSSKTYRVILRKPSKEDQVILEGIFEEYSLQVRPGVLRTRELVGTETQRVLEFTEQDIHLPLIQEDIARVQKLICAIKPDFSSICMTLEATGNSLNAAFKELPQNHPDRDILLREIFQHYKKIADLFCLINTKIKLEQESKTEVFIDRSDFYFAKAFLALGQVKAKTRADLLSLAIYASTESESLCKDPIECLLNNFKKLPAGLISSYRNVAFNVICLAGKQIKSDKTNANAYYQIGRHFKAVAKNFQENGYLELGRYYLNCARKNFTRASLYGKESSFKLAPDELVEVRIFLESKEGLPEQKASGSKLRATDFSQIKRHLDAARSFLQQNRKDDCLDSIKQALKLGSKSAYTYYEVGEIYYSQKHYLEAYEWFSKAIQLDPQHSRAFFRLAALHEAFARSFNQDAAFSWLVGNEAEIICQYAQSALDSNAVQKRLTPNSRLSSAEEEQVKIIFTSFIIGSASKKSNKSCGAKTVSQMVGVPKEKSVAEQKTSAALGLNKDFNSSIGVQMQSGSKNKKTSEQVVASDVIAPTSLAESKSLLSAAPAAQDSFSAEATSIIETKKEGQEFFNELFANLEILFQKATALSSENENLAKLLFVRGHEIIINLMSMFNIDDIHIKGVALRKRFMGQLSSYAVEVIKKADQKTTILRIQRPNPSENAAFKKVLRECALLSGPGPLSSQHTEFNGDTQKTLKYIDWHHYYPAIVADIQKVERLFKQKNLDFTLTKVLLDDVTKEIESAFSRLIEGVTNRDESLQELGQHLEKVADTYLKLPHICSVTKDRDSTISECLAKANKCFNTALVIVGKILIKNSPEMPLKVSDKPTAQDSTQKLLANFLHPGISLIQGFRRIYFQQILFAMENMQLKDKEISIQYQMGQNFRRLGHNFHELGYPALALFYLQQTRKVWGQVKEQKATSKQLSSAELSEVKEFFNSKEGMPGQRTPGTKINTKDFPVVKGFLEQAKAARSTVECVEYIRKALQVKKDYASIYSEMGEICFGLERYLDAYEWFSKAIQYDPDHSIAHAKLAGIHHIFSQIFAEDSFGWLAEYQNEFILHFCQEALRSNAIPKAKRLNPNSTLPSDDEEDLSATVERLKKIVRSDRPQTKKKVAKSKRKLKEQGIESESKASLPPSLDQAPLGRLLERPLSPAKLQAVEGVATSQTESMEQRVESEPRTNLLPSLDQALLSHSAESPLFSAKAQAAEGVATSQIESKEQHGESEPSASLVSSRDQVPLSCPTKKPSAVAEQKKSDENILKSKFDTWFQQGHANLSKMKLDLAVKFFKLGWDKIVNPKKDDAVKIDATKKVEFGKFLGISYLLRGEYSQAGEVFTRALELLATKDAESKDGIVDTAEVKVLAETVAVLLKVEAANTLFVKNKNYPTAKMEYEAALKVLESQEKLMQDEQVKDHVKTIIQQIQANVKYCKNAILRVEQAQCLSEAKAFLEQKDYANAKLKYNRIKLIATELKNVKLVAQMTTTISTIDVVKEARDQYQIDSKTESFDQSRIACESALQALSLLPEMIKEKQHIESMLAFIFALDTFKSTREKVKVDSKTENFGQSKIACESALKVLPLVPEMVKEKQYIETILAFFQLNSDVEKASSFIESGDSESAIALLEKIEDGWRAFTRPDSNKRLSLDPAKKMEFAKVIGILYLLKGTYSIAESFFQQALENTKPNKLEEKAESLAPLSHEGVLLSLVTTLIEIAQHQQLLSPDDSANTKVLDETALLSLSELETHITAKSIKGCIVKARARIAQRQDDLLRLQLTLLLENTDRCFVDQEYTLAVDGYKKTKEIAIQLKNKNLVAQLEVEILKSTLAEIAAADDKYQRNIATGDFSEAKIAYEKVLRLLDGTPKLVHEKAHVVATLALTGSGSTDLRELFDQIKRIAESKDAIDEKLIGSLEKRFLGLDKSHKQLAGSEEAKTFLLELLLSADRQRVIEIILAMPTAMRIVFPELAITFQTMGAVDRAKLVELIKQQSSDFFKLSAILLASFRDDKIVGSLTPQAMYFVLIKTETGTLLENLSTKVKINPDEKATEDQALAWLRESQKHFIKLIDTTHPIIGYPRVQAATEAKTALTEQAISPQMYPRGMMNGNPYNSSYTQPGEHPSGFQGSFSRHPSMDGYRPPFGGRGHSLPVGGPLIHPPVFSGFHAPTPRASERRGAGYNGRPYRVGDRPLQPSSVQKTPLKAAGSGEYKAGSAPAEAVVTHRAVKKLVAS